MIHEIISDARKHWISQSGLMRLRSPSESGVLDGVETCWNDNGVFFLCVFILLARAHGYRPIDAAKIEETLAWLEVPEHHGLFNRNVYKSFAPKETAVEAHDNYAAICTLSKLYSFRYTNDICVYGEAHGWNFNNHDGTWTFRTQRQGGEVAFYKIMNDQTPSMIDALWMLGGFLILLFKWDYSLVLLMYVRMAGLKLCKPRVLWVTAIVDTMILLWDAVFQFRGGIHEAVKKSFHSSHPNYKLGVLFPKGNVG
jgi:hypothetical protein